MPKWRHPYRFLLIWMMTFEMDQTQYYRPQAINCYHCASSEYEHPFKQLRSLAFGSNLKYDSACDDPWIYGPENYPSVSCMDACVTVFEQQYIGGIVNPQKPYSFIRGCSTEIFARGLPRYRAREIDYLHHKNACFPVQMQQILPDTDVPDYYVMVCSCVTPGCNMHTTLPTSSCFDSRIFGGLGKMILIVLVIFLLNFEHIL